MDGRGGGHLGQSGGHELQQCHLRGGVLHRDPVRSEVGVGLAPHHCLAARVREVVDEDLLGERERPAEAITAETEIQANVAAAPEVQANVVAEGEWADERPVPAGRPSSPRD